MAQKTATILQSVRRKCSMPQGAVSAKKQPMPSPHILAEAEEDRILSQIMQQDTDNDILRGAEKDSFENKLAQYL